MSYPLQLFFIVCLTLSLIAQSCQSTTKVEGTVLLVGNEPFTELVLKTNQGYYRIVNNAKAKELREKYQNHNVQLEGRTLPPSKVGEIPSLVADIEVKKYTILKK